MKRSLIPLLCVASLGCPMGQPALELSGGAVRVDSELTVTATATNAEGTAGTGTVTFSATLGTLSATSGTLADGSASTKLRCPRVVSGCVAGATIEVTARWASPKGEVQKSVVVRVTATPASDGGFAVDAGADAGTTVDAGAVDAGAVDAGAVDAGSSDGGAADAGLEPEDDAGVISIGTSVGTASALVMGRLGAPRTLGFSPLTSNTTVQLGFDSLPERRLLVAQHLVYLRQGVVRVWEEDHPDPDAGSDDGGLVDGGGAGPFPLFAPEANDPVLATCQGFFADPDAGAVVSITRTSTHNLWVGCAERAGQPATAYFHSAAKYLNPVVFPSALAATDSAVLGQMPNGTLFVLTPSNTLVSTPPLPRTFSKLAARATRTSFELLAYDMPFARCSLAIIDARTGRYSEVEVTGLPMGARCLTGRFLEGTDSVAYQSVGVPGIVVHDFQRGAMPVDGGTEGVLVFSPGPPSDFLAVPPVLSVNFDAGVEVISW